MADRPDINEEAANWTLLALQIPDEVLASPEWALYEWVEPEKPYREWLIPAALANQYGPPQVVSPEEESEIVDSPR